MSEEQDDQSAKDLNGLGGWLIIVGFITLCRPIKLFSEMWTLYNEVYASGLLAELSSPEKENYQPAFMPIFVMEISLNLLWLIVSIFLIYLFFSKKTLFSKLLIALLIATPIFMIADVAVINYFYPEQPILNVEISRTVLPTVFSAAIWVPYLLVSERVKATFVNPLRPKNDAEIFS